MEPRRAISPWWLAPHFNHNEFWMGRGIEQGQRHANVVVDSCHMAHEPGEWPRHLNFLGGGFAIAAGHGKHGTGPRVSVGQGKLLQCDKRVFDHGDVGVGFPGRVGGDCVHGSRLQCMIYEGIAIKFAPFYGDVNVVFEINTGVCFHGRDLTLSRCSMVSKVAAACNHEFTQRKTPRRGRRVVLSKVVDASLRTAMSLTSVRDGCAHAVHGATESNGR